MRKLNATVTLLFFILLLQYQVSAQVLNKMRQKLEQTADQAFEKATGNKSNTGNANTGTAAGTNNSGKARNAGGAGLVSTPPDVKQNLSSAESAFKTGKYSETRYALQQAMLGVEMEIGHKILKALPETVSGLKKDEAEDQVTSTGWGWAGLTIQRQYKNNDDKQLNVMVANNAVWMNALNMYFNNGGAGQTTGGKQNWKQTTVKGNKAIIEYSEDSGYKLSVPLGQASLLVYEGINFKNEQELMTAANTIDIANIKKMLGEK